MKKTMIRFISDVCEIKLSETSDVVLIDRTDLTFFAERRWYIDHHTNGTTKYLKTSGENKTVCFHRLILNPPDHLVVDHINGNGLDNRRCNLRIVTTQVNRANSKRHKKASSRFHGVRLDKKTGKFIATVFWKYQAIHLGKFDQEIHAALAYNKYITTNSLDKRLNIL